MFISEMTSTITKSSLVVCCYVSVDGKEICWKNVVPDNRAEAAVSIRHKDEATYLPSATRGPTVNVNEKPDLCLRIGFSRPTEFMHARPCASNIPHISYKDVQ